MSEKEAVLEQLNQIESSLIDNERFMPFNYRVLIMWGFISAILILSFEDVAKLYSVWIAVSYIGIVTTIGFVIEVYFTKKENKKYDIKKFTKLQKFIETNYTFSIIFSMALTYIFVSNDLGVYSYLAWMFMFGYADFITSFVVNCKKMSAVGLINITASIAIVSITFIFGTDVIESFMKYIAVLFLSGSLIINGLILKEVSKSV